MIQYGFQRLALLNSAGYQRAEVPLDAAVSLIAPNNTGKTSLINALQFLLIIDRRRMDFGAHDVETSRRFYFPNNSAYVLLEVALPGTGTVVLGCVGKGVSHDYEYFAYKGELCLDDFRLPDGSTLQQPQLQEHMERVFGRLVFSYSGTEFAEALYGGRRRRLDGEPDFTVFKLEQASNAAIFQKVLTRTLRLDRLTSSEVKAYLLEIFRNDLPDANIDFKAEWERAFAEVNADRAQFDAAHKQRAQISQLEKDHEQRLALRGKVQFFRPLIDACLGEWDVYQREERASLSARLQEIEALDAGRQDRDRGYVREMSTLERSLADLDSKELRFKELSQRFSLIPSRSVLEDQLVAAKAKYDEQAAVVVNATSSSPAAIRREIAENEQRRHQLTRQLETLADNLYLRLCETLDGAELDKLNRVLSQSTMTLSPSEFSVEPERLKAWLRSAEASVIALPGLRIDLAMLTPQHQQRTRDELLEMRRELDVRAGSLGRSLQAALEIDAARNRLGELERARRSVEQDIEAFDAMVQLRQTHAARLEEMGDLRSRKGVLQMQLERSRSEAKQLRDEAAAVQKRMTELDNDHRQIVHLRERRGDDDPLFGSLAEMPHHPWMGSDEIELAGLAVALDAYQTDCRKLISLEERVRGQVASLHVGGLTKYQFSDSPELEVKHIIGFAAHLTQEAEALERKARSAVVNVTACLRELRDGLHRFKAKMNQFNRLIGKRQLSDLGVFKIDPVDEAPLVEAVEQLISTAEQAGNGETFELFNHQSVLDDATLNRAKSLLIDEGSARGCLRVEHFFRLEFIVGKVGRKPEAFKEIDSAASNGTVLMAKLVTGLALLHQMKDKRHDVQAVCYLDEASALDQRNQRNLIQTAEDFGFALVFASPAPLITARYCVPIVSQGGKNLISRKAWQVVEPLEGQVVA